MELFKPVIAKCPACGHIGVVKGFGFMLLPGENTLFDLNCANCGNVWKESPKTITDKKEATTMQVTYNGFTGELVKLERSPIAGVTLTVTCSPFSAEEQKNSWRYDLSLYDSEKKATISFTGVKLENVKFLGGAVTFGG